MGQRQTKAEVVLTAGSAGGFRRDAKTIGHGRVFAMRKRFVKRIMGEAVRRGLIEGNPDHNVAAGRRHHDPGRKKRRSARVMKRDERIHRDETGIGGVALANQRWRRISQSVGGENRRRVNILCLERRNEFRADRVGCYALLRDLCFRWCWDRWAFGREILLTKDQHKQSKNSQRDEYPRIPGNDEAGRTRFLRWRVHSGITCKKCGDVQAYDWRVCWNVTDFIEYIME